MRLIDADSLMRSIDINWGCDECNSQCVDKWGVCSCLVHQLKEIVMTAPTISLEEKQATSNITSNWIPVSERLPDVGEDVLTYGRFDEQEILALYEETSDEMFWLDENGYNCELDYVLAWMPLPTPYRKDGD